MRKLLLALVLSLWAGQSLAVDNYAATAGSGLTFAAKDATGVLYSRFIGCDNTTVSQCWAVDASGRLTVNINGTVTVTGAGGTFPATQSGTWTVQPGNTANTTAWLVTGTGGTFPSTNAASSASDGWDVTQGAKADSVCSTATGTCSIVALIKYLNNAAIAPLPPQVGIGNSVTPIGGVASSATMYETVAASQTAQVLGPTGATGDYLSHCVIYPVTTGAGAVTVFDNTNAAGTNVITFTSGTLSNLAPISIPVGAVSTAGAWKVTTGTNVTVTCYGKFT